MFPTSVSTPQSLNPFEKDEMCRKSTDTIGPQQLFPQGGLLSCVALRGKKERHCRSCYLASRAAANSLCVFGQVPFLPCHLLSLLYGGWSSTIWNGRWDCSALLFYDVHIVLSARELNGKIVASFHL